jgi:hypothetical protein
MRVMDALHKRMERHGLTLHPEKTRLFAFSPPRGVGSRKSCLSNALISLCMWMCAGIELAQQIGE